MKVIFLSPVESYKGDPLFDNALKQMIGDIALRHAGQYRIVL